jgi:opacity protein-like surface antigen
VNRTLALAAVVAAVLASSAAAADFTDPPGDAGSAPDITKVSATKTGDALQFRITVANMNALAPDAELFLPIDTDRSTATGDQHGVDFVYSLRQGGAELRTRRWTGSQHAPFASTATGGHAAGVATFVVRLAELGSPAVVGFGAVGTRGQDSDAAPANGSWAFRVRAALRLRSVAARFTPRSPRAGGAFRLTAATGRLSDGTNRSGAPSCQARLAGARLAGSGCRWRVPVGARGKQLVVSVRVRVAGVGASTRTYRFRVR